VEVEHRLAERVREVSQFRLSIDRSIDAPAPAVGVPRLFRTTTEKNPNQLAASCDGAKSKRVRRRRRREVRGGWGRAHLWGGRWPTAREDAGEIRGALVGVLLGEGNAGINGV
jgi:hypothetical protein